MSRSRVPWTAPGSTRIPGYLFATGRASRASIDARGELSLALSGDSPAGPLAVELEPGRWRVSVATAEADRASEVELVVRRLDSPDQVVTHGSILSVAGRGPIAAMPVSRADRPVRLREVAFRAEPAPP